MSELPNPQDPYMKKAFRWLEEMLRVVVANDRRPVAHQLNVDVAAVVPASRALEANNAMMLERHRASYFATAASQEPPRVIPSPMALNANNSLKLEGHRADYFATASGVATDLDELEVKLFLLEGR